MLKFSQRVRPGDLVVKHGKKYVRLGRQKNRSVAGVYRPPTEQTVITAAGVKRISLPARIVVSGPTNVRFLE